MGRTRNKTTHFVWHCSATKENVDYTIDQLRKDHKDRGFIDIGYHFYVRKDGSVELGRPITDWGAHAKGFNGCSIGACYEGGLDSAGNAKDTRTPDQKATMKVINSFAKVLYNSLIFIGHRDTSPDKNKDGKITPDEWIKLCPCFDVKSEY